jgi:uncharacterized protein YxjI
MTRTLSIANKLLSIRGRMAITDDQGRLAYEAKGELAWLSPVWEIGNGSVALAQVRKKLFAWSETWDVRGEAGRFRVKRKLFSWARSYRVEGGEFDGVAIKGGLFDLNFEIVSGDRTLAKATGKILSFRDRHTIEVLGDDELFVVIIMVILHLDRRDDSAQTSG